jgi:hypothetical protein
MTDEEIEGIAKSCIDQAVDWDKCVWSFTDEELLLFARKLIESVEKDALTLALRLLGEDESTFSPETAEAMDRWRPRCMEVLQKAE